MISFHFSPGRSTFCKFAQNSKSGRIEILSPVDRRWRKERHMVSSQIRLLQQGVKFVITPSVADFSSENESCNVIEDTDDFTL